MKVVPLALLLVGGSSVHAAGQPLPVHLSPIDRGRVSTTFDRMAQSIAGYEASAEVTSFTSKYDAVLAKSPFLFATSGIEVVVECSELAENLRLAIPVLAQFRTLDLQEIAERLAGVRWVLDVEDGVRMDRVFKIGLSPCVAEPVASAEPVKRDMERRYLQFVIQGSDGMLVKRLRRKS